MVNKTVIETTPTVCSFHAKNTSINSCLNSPDRHLIIHDNDEFKSLEGNSLHKSDSNDSISHEWNVNDNWSESNSVVTNESNTKVINSKTSSNSTKLSLLYEPGDNNNNQIKLQSQLDHFRKESHEVYLRNCFTDENSLNVNDHMTNSTKEHWNNINDKWRENTVLIAGDSIISGLVEDYLSKNKSIKVRTFPGSRINDFYSYLLPLLNKEPTKIIVHCGTNDAYDKTVEQLIDELLKLKTFIKKMLPSVDVVLSFPTIRDDFHRNPKSIYTIRKLSDLLADINLDGIYHNNITKDCLGKGKLHLNGKGLSRLAMNFQSYIRHF